MSRHLLIPVEGVEDAVKAMVALPAVMERGQDGVILAVLAEPKGQYLGMSSHHRIDEPMIGEGGNEGPRVVDDEPDFMPREEVAEIQSREVYDTLERLSQPLRDAGRNLSVDVIFSNDPATAVMHHARDIEADQILVTGHFSHKFKQESTESRLTILPGT
jgi:hypothetical protein